MAPGQCLRSTEYLKLKEEKEKKNIYIQQSTLLNKNMVHIFLNWDKANTGYFYCVV